MPTQSDDRPYRCACHNRDAHLFCPALLSLRNYALITGRCHMVDGRLVAGSQSEPIRINRKNHK